ncbi:MAG: DUF397 domain-containing protein [Streptosporangiaceae bacterium]
MTAPHDLPQPAFRKSSHSGDADNCVEIALSPHGTVAVRDSKNPDHPALALTPIAWRSFTLGVRSTWRRTRGIIES